MEGLLANDLLSGWPLAGDDGRHRWRAEHRAGRRRVKWASDVSIHSTHRLHARPATSHALFFRRQAAVRVILFRVVHEVGAI